MPANFGSDLGNSFTPGQERGAGTQLTPGTSEALKVISLRLPSFLGGSPIAPESLLRQQVTGGARPISPGSLQQLQQQVTGQGGDDGSNLRANLAAGQQQPGGTGWAAQGSQGGYSQPSPFTGGGGRAQDLFALINSWVGGQPQGGNSGAGAPPAPGSSAPPDPVWGPSWGPGFTNTENPTDVPPEFVRRPDGYGGASTPNQPAFTGGPGGGSYGGDTGGGRFV